MPENLEKHHLVSAPHKYLWVNKLSDAMTPTVKILTTKMSELTKQIEDAELQRHGLRKALAFLMCPYAERDIIKRLESASVVETFVVTAIEGGREDSEYYRCKIRVLRRDGTLGDRESYVNFYDYEWETLPDKFVGEITPIKSRIEKLEERDKVRKQQQEWKKTLKDGIGGKRKRRRRGPDGKLMPLEDSGEVVESMPIEDLKSVPVEEVEEVVENEEFVKMGQPSSEVVNYCEEPPTWEE